MDKRQNPTHTELNPSISSKTNLLIDAQHKVAYNTRHVFFADLPFQSQIKPNPPKTKISD